LHIWNVSLDAHRWFHKLLAWKFTQALIGALKSGDLLSGALALDESEWRSAVGCRLDAAALELCWNANNILRYKTSAPHVFLSCSCAPVHALLFTFRYVSGSEHLAML
jgi:hypothetical protein